MKRLLGLCALSTLPFNSSAADLYERETLRLDLGTFLSSQDVGLRVDSTAGPLALGASIDLEDDFGFDADEETFRGLISYRPWDRHRFYYGYFDFDRSSSKKLARDFDVADTTFSAGLDIKAKFRTEIQEVGYRYSFYQTDDIEVFAGLGAHLLKMDFGVAARGSAVVEPGDQLVTILPESQTASFTAEYAESIDGNGPLPMFGVGFDYQLSKGLYLHASSDYFSLTTGDYEGQLLNLNFGADYFFTENVGLGLSYTVFNLDVDYEDDDWRGHLDWGYNGLSAKLSLRF